MLFSPHQTLALTPRRPDSFLLRLMPLTLRDINGRQDRTVQNEPDMTGKRDALDTGFFPFCPQNNPANGAQLCPFYS